jgi:hypothetical protein
MLARDSGLLAKGVVDVVDEAIDVRRGVKVFVPVTPGRLDASELRETARDADGVCARLDGVLGRIPPGVRGARYD